MGSAVMVVHSVSNGSAATSAQQRAESRLSSAASSAEKRFTVAAPTNWGTLNTTARRRAQGTSTP